MSARRHPLVAMLLSLVLPGLGQLANSERAKGIAVLCIDAGIALGIALATIGPAALRSKVAVLMLAVVYPFIWIPAVVDAYQQAAGLAKPLLSGQKSWYVILMLLTVGPGAIPLLWQSPQFSRSAKMIWTVAVIMIALSCIWVALVLGPAVEQHFQQLKGAVTPF